MLDRVIKKRNPFDPEDAAWMAEYLDEVLFLAEDDLPVPAGEFGDQMGAAASAGGEVFDQWWARHQKETTIWNLILMCRQYQELLRELAKAKRTGNEPALGSKI